MRIGRLTSLSAGKKRISKAATRRMRNGGKRGADIGRGRVMSSEARRIAANIAKLLDMLRRKAPVERLAP
jgi:hypothetical protein